MGAGRTLPVMTRNLTLTALLTVVALAATGCNVGLPGAARPTASPTAANLVAIYHEVAQCVRDHGMPDFPDPTVDAQGQPHLPDGTATPSASIVQACQPILNQIPPADRPAGTQPNDPAMMRRFAQCMRAHGITDWPDPNANGDFPLPPSLAGNMKRGPRWPQIQAAWNGPCKQYNPAGHISTVPA
jgi:hypothetical protein